MKIDLVNETKLTVNKADILQWVEEELKQQHHNIETEIEVLIVSSHKIRKLNNKYRHKDAVTDVLSFPLSDSVEKKKPVNHLGTIVLCIEQAREQADENNRPLSSELEMLIKHSTRHLLGIHHPE